MADDIENGAKILLEQIDEILKNKRLTEKDRLLWRVHKYLLAEVPVTRRDISGLRKAQEKLEKHSIILWAKAYPKMAGLLIVSGLVANSMINWSGVRKPLIRSALLSLGIDVPLDSIP